MLDGRVILVTGAASGMGRASAQLCARLGASVVATDINGDGVSSVVAGINDSGGTALAYQADLTLEDDVNELVSAAVDLYGRIDALHNNAYAVHPGAAVGLIDTSLESWEWTIKTCLTSQFLCARAVIPHMIRQGRGSIINVASGSGVAGSPTAGAYGVAKAGVVVLTKYIATQYGKSGVRCNTIIPGRTMGTGFISDSADPQNVLARQVSEQALDAVCMPHLAGADDVAPVVAFLASDEARYVQAATIDVNGGMFAHMPGAPWAPSKA